MTKKFETLMAVIPFLESYPIGIKLLVAIWVLFTASLVILLLFGKPKTSKLEGTVKSDKSVSAPKSNLEKSTQNVDIKDSPKSTVYQAGGDILINSTIPSKKLIQSILVEARLTCELNAGAELPPSEVPFMPLGDANAYLESVHKVKVCHPRA